MIEHHRPTPFNSPLEAGVRSLAILTASFPQAYDLQRLVEMDYLVVHSGDALGPSSLHAPLPLRAGELLVRRGLIEDGLLLMNSRNLVSRIPSEDGIYYSASEAAAPFMAAMTTQYMKKLIERAQWAVERFGHASTDEIRRVTRQLFDGWSSEFQAVQLPLGDL